MELVNTCSCKDMRARPHVEEITIHKNVAHVHTMIKIYIN